MVTAIVMIKADRKSIPETAQALADIDGVAEVYSISGDYDIIAVLRVPEYEQLAALVTQNLLEMPTILATQTHMAFQTYSKQDLEGMFTIGEEVAWTGGSVWESNPPETLFRPHTDFEDQASHQAQSAPAKRGVHRHIPVTAVYVTAGYVSMRGSCCTRETASVRLAVSLGTPIADQFFRQHDEIALVGSQECFHHDRVELRARVVLEFLDRTLDGERLSPRHVRYQDVEGLRYRYYTGAEGDVAAAQPVRISLAVKPFVMMLDHRQRVLETFHLLQHADSYG